MIIDCSALYAIGREGTKDGATTKGAPPEQNHQTPRPDQGLTVLQREADQARVDRERARAVYQEYQKAIIASEEGMREILLGMKRGDPTDILFLQAVEALAAATSNRVFLSQAKAAIEERRRPLSAM